MPKNDITVLLTGYKRPKNFKPQLEAVQGQSIKPADIWLWWNKHKAVDMPPEVASINHIVCRPNMGVWSRFYCCLNFTTEYICVFDDDTIPGRRWLENCLTTIKSTDGLLGTNGISFIEGTHKPNKRTGWHRPNPETTRVDIVGHSWFFRRESLRAFVQQERANGFITCGEDMHFSVALQLLHNEHTYVPPHPPGNRELWGSLQGGLGRDKQALWSRPGEAAKKRKTFNEYRQLGWQLAHEDQP